MKRQFQLGKIYKKYGIALIMLLEILLFTILQPKFLTLSNLLSVGQQISFLGITAIGMTMVLLTGGIDISVGSQYALAGVLGALLFKQYNLPVWCVIVICLLVGTVIGTINGVIIAVFKVPAMIATLGMQTLLSGIAYLACNGIPVVAKDPVFQFLGQGKVFGFIPLSFVIMCILFLIGTWFLETTFLGRRIYAVGGNVEASRLSGINTIAVITMTYAITGALASLTGLIMAARMGSGQPSAGSDLAMNVLTAVVIGGVSLTGGKGSIVNVFFGTFVMGFLINGMYMLGLSEYVQWVVKGIVLISVVVMSNFPALSMGKARGSAK